jgi:hypothetical protein
MLHDGEDRGQSAVLVAISLLVLVIFAAITVDLSSAYLGRRTAQNAADGAALAAARQLAHQYNQGVYNDTLIKRELNNFAELNGAGDTDGVPANEVNASVTGVYLGQDQNAIGVVGSGFNPEGAMGVESTVFITTPAFFGGIVGQGGYPVQAQAVVMLDFACGADCIVPIATHWWPFTTTAECYNIYNGEGAGNFGWLNWELQGVDCTTGEGCTSTPELKWNLDPENECRSGFISVGELVAGTPSSRNPAQLQDLLKEYIDNELEFTVVVWERSLLLGGANQAYEVAGFARMQLVGYLLSQGQGKDVTYGHTGYGCETVGVDPHNGVRLTAEFRGWVGGEGGSCHVDWGTLRAPTLRE